MVIWVWKFADIKGEIKKLISANLFTSNEIYGATEKAFAGGLFSRDNSFLSSFCDVFK